MKKKYLVLANGKIFEGVGFGYEGTAVGEIVFNTAAVGYTEILTKPAYYGQIVAQTFPLIGNSGMNAEDFESQKPALFGYVVREYCEEPSNFRNQMTLDSFLKQNKIPAICGIDTRELTEIIRDNGSMGACITDDVNCPEVKTLKDYKVTDALEKTSCPKAYFKAENQGKYNVVMINYGANISTVEHFTSAGCNVTCLPYNATAQEVLALDPDGIILSQGAGDPNENLSCIETVKQLAGKKPIFAVGLGHQIFALSQGAKVEKMSYGHHGASQPVKCLETNKVLITCQNHCYSVVCDTLPKTATVTHINVNDNTCEGVFYPALKALTLQFNPDIKLATEKFVEMMEEEKVCH